MDVFGLVMKAELVKREGRLDLDLVIGVEMNNPMAVQTYQYIVNGTVLGVSVGVIVTDAEKSDDEDGQGRDIFDINRVIPIEASVVGIPANQTAWKRQAIKSLYQRGAIKLDSKDIEARPWLKTVAQIKEATEGHKDGEILPETEYHVEVQPQGGGASSPPGIATTWIWGDTYNSLGAPNLDDGVCALDGVSAFVFGGFSSSGNDVAAT